MGINMKWETTTKHQTNIEIDGRLFNIVCESDPMMGFSLVIDGEYICDLEELPTHDDLLGYIDDQITLNDMANEVYQRRIS